MLTRALFIKSGLALPPDGYDDQIALLGAGEGADLDHGGTGRQVLRDLGGYLAVGGDEAAGAEIRLSILAIHNTAAAGGNGLTGVVPVG